MPSLSFENEVNFVINLSVGSIVRCVDFWAILWRPSCRFCYLKTIDPTFSTSTYRLWIQVVKYVSSKDDLIYVLSIDKWTSFFKYFHLYWGFEEGFESVVSGITQGIVMISFIRERVLVKVNLKPGSI